MGTRLDRSLSRFVDEGRISPVAAADLLRDLRGAPTSVRQRLAELAGYVGAFLATIGLFLLGTQVWSDVAEVFRAVLPAVGSGLLLVVAWRIAADPVALATHPARGRLVQVLGAVSAVLALLTIILAFTPEGREPQPWQVTAGGTIALVISLVIRRMAPGPINTLVTAVLALMTAQSIMGLFGVEDVPGLGPALMIALGVAGSTILYRYFPPEWLLRVLGILSWLMGLLGLMTAVGPQESLLHWLGRLAAVALIVVGTWRFAQDDDWVWAVGAGLAAAVLVGLWTLELMNAGIALLISGLVLILAALGIAGVRTVTHPHKPVDERPGSDLVNSGGCAPPSAPAG